MERLAAAPTGARVCPPFVLRCCCRRHWLLWTKTGQHIYSTPPLSLLAVSNKMCCGGCYLVEHTAPAAFSPASAAQATAGSKAASRPEAHVPPLSLRVAVGGKGLFDRENGADTGSIPQRKHACSKKVLGGRKHTHTHEILDPGGQHNPTACTATPGRTAGSLAFPQCSGVKGLRVLERLSIR